MDLGEFEASLVYIPSFRLARATWGDPVSEREDEGSKGLFFGFRIFL